MAAPFSHLCRHLEEGDVDAIIGFQEPDEKKIPGIYEELAKVPVACICPADSPIASRQSVTVEDLEKERLILLKPVHGPVAIAQLQGQIIGGRAPSQLYFCESSEAAVVLIQAGYGISLLPKFSHHLAGFGKFPKPASFNSLPVPLSCSAQNFEYYRSK